MDHETLQPGDRTFLERMCFDEHTPLTVDAKVEQRLLRQGYLMRRGNALLCTHKALELFRDDARTHRESRLVP